MNMHPLCQLQLISSTKSFLLQVTCYIYCFTFVVPPSIFKISGEWTWSPICPWSMRPISKVFTSTHHPLIFYHVNVRNLAALPLSWLIHVTINIKYFSGQCPKSPFLAPISLRCSGERWEGKATVPSAFLPANVSAFNMFAIHKATLIEEDQVSCVVVCQNAEFPNQLRLKIISLCVSDFICRALPIISFQKFIDKSFYL